MNLRQTESALNFSQLESAGRHRIAYTERCPDRHGAIATSAEHIALSARIWGNLAAYDRTSACNQDRMADLVQFDLGQAARDSCTGRRFPDVGSAASIISAKSVMDSSLWWASGTDTSAGRFRLWEARAARRGGNRYSATPIKEVKNSTEALPDAVLVRTHLLFPMQSVICGQNSCDTEVIQEFRPALPPTP